MSIPNQNMHTDAMRFLEASPREKAQSAKNTHVAMYSPAVTELTVKAFLLLMVAIVFAGWSVKDRDYLTADEGLGYALGIVGSVMMLVLLLYPLRKKAKFMRSLGAVKHWFRLHKMLGILGPVLILFHANFKLHAVNSNVALFSMLLVMLSGLIGRFIYVRIHYSHYGQVISLQELQSQFGLSKREMDDEAYITPGVKARLHQFEDYELSSVGVMHGIWKLVTLGRRAAAAEVKAMRELKHELGMQAQEEGWAFGVLRARLDHDRELIEEYLGSVRRVTEYNAYRRIFSLWHVLHIPLFFMMLVTAIIHVVAVHMY